MKDLSRPVDGVVYPLGCRDRRHRARKRLVISCAAFLALGTMASASSPPAPAGSVADGSPVANPHPPPQDPATPETRPPLAAADAARLKAWFGAVGARRGPESFGDLLVRAGRLQLGEPYFVPPQTAGPEILRVDLRRFECVSFVESTAALARCVWRGRPDEACFLNEVEAFRYRRGVMKGYGSRLHYFTDWISDNEDRGRLQQQTAPLGGKSHQYLFNYMSTHRRRYPSLADSTVFEQIVAVEERLSQREVVVLDRADIAAVSDRVANGDVVALVSDKHSGLLIGHTGFADRVGSRFPRFLHASSYHQRVLLTASGLADYVNRRPERRGILVVRLLPPPLVEGRESDGP